MTHAEYMVEWRAKNRERAREISREGSAKHRAANLEKVRSGAVRHNDKIRAFVQNFFGGKCARCGCDDPRVLQMDHITGDGSKLRRANRDGLSYKYKLVKNTPELAKAMYQLLCANCNIIKQWEDDEFSRKRGSDDPDRPYRQGS